MLLSLLYLCNKNGDGSDFLHPPTAIADLEPKGVDL